MGIIIKPIVTEKHEQRLLRKMANRYGFRVSPDANKQRLRKPFEDMYNVTCS
jgi:large subunit ribosomal protein L23